MRNYYQSNNNKNGRRITSRRIQILILYFAIICFNPTSSFNLVERLSLSSPSPVTFSRIKLSSKEKSIGNNNNNNNNNNCPTKRPMFTRKRVSIEMGAKGDGKQRRKKQSSSSSSPSSSSQQQQSQPSQQPAAPRVSNNINIPIRRQIQYGKINKKFREGGAGGTASFRQKKVVRTKYRRTWDEEEIEIKAEERRRKGQNPDWDVILNQTAASPLLIVDGYNIIYKWSRLKKHMVKGDPSRARQLLIDDLENMRSIKGWRIEVRICVWVYDCVCVSRSFHIRFCFGL